MDVMFEQYKQYLRDISNTVSKLDKRDCLLVISYLVSSILIVVTAQRHELWGDEVDAWLCARDETLSSMFQLSGYVGSPGLWYWLLMPFAKLGLSCSSMTILNVSFGLVSNFLLVFLSPFPIVLRLLLPFSYLFLFEYPVVSRSYGVSVLLIFLLAFFHRNRFTRPYFYSSILALLANANLHSLVISVCITCAFSAERLYKRLKLLPIVCSLAGILAAVLQLIPPGDGQLNGLRSASLQALLGTIKRCFYPPFDLINHNGQLGHYDESLVLKSFAIIGSFGLIAIAVLVVRKSKWSLWCCVSSTLGLLLLFLKHSGGLRHWGYLEVMIFYSVWTLPQIGSAAEPKTFTRAFYALLFSTLLYNAVFGVYALREESNCQFSGSTQCADFLKKFPSSMVICATPPYSTESILAYLPQRKFYYLGTESFGTHLLWTYSELRNYDLSPKQIFERIDSRFGSTRPILLVTGGELDGAESHGYRLLQQSNERTITTSERFSVYGRNVSMSKPKP